MDFLNFITAIHHRLDVDIPELDYPKLVTLDGAVIYLKAKLELEQRLKVSELTRHCGSLRVPMAQLQRSNRRGSICTSSSRPLSSASMSASSL